MLRLSRAVPALLFTMCCASSVGAAEAETVSSASTASPPGSFPRTAIQLGMGPSAIASTWRGDVAAGGSLRLGLLLLGVVSPDILTRLAYSTVDDRMLTYLSLGVTGYVPLRVVRPYARLAFAHQHEESRAAIEDQPGNALLGVGPGIRHRGGVAGALGVEAPLARKGRSIFSIGGDMSATHFPDPRGPATYFGGTLWASIHHGL
jgi:hypothetical protein